MTSPKGAYVSVRSDRDDLRRRIGEVLDLPWIRSLSNGYGGDVREILTGSRRGTTLPHAPGRPRIARVRSATTATRSSQAWTLTRWTSPATRGGATPAARRADLPLIARAVSPVAEPFWNLTAGDRPAEPVPGLFAGICESTHHVYDEAYGPLVCARCGRDSRPARRRWWRRRTQDKGESGEVRDV
jgi:hypothetical protein